MTKLKIVFFFATIGFINQVFAKEIALSFDDAPRAASVLSGKERAALLVEGLQSSGVQQVAFFANSIRFNEEGLQRLKFYTDHGHLIGNHTHSHPEFNKIDLQKYIEDMQLAHRQMETLDGFIKWFRFPFLREGDTLEKRDGMRHELERLSYFNAYITVNNYDWYMESLFQKAKRSAKTINMNALRDTYVSVLVESVEYYDQMAREVLGRSPRHVILLHENDLAAYFVKDFVQAIQKRGWKIITPSDSYQDEIASYTTASLFPANPGRIAEIAKDKGWKGRLWHEACDEEFLDQLFIKNGVY